MQRTFCCPCAVKRVDARPTRTPFPSPPCPFLSFPFLSSPRGQTVHYALQPGQPAPARTSAANTTLLHQPQVSPNTAPASKKACDYCTVLRLPGKATTRPRTATTRTSSASTRTVAYPLQPIPSVTLTILAVTSPLQLLIPDSSLTVAYPVLTRCGTVPLASTFP